MKSSIDGIFRAVKSHHEFIKYSLPMVASENVTSRSVRRLLSSDLAHRYAEGEVGKRFYQGCRFIDEIESEAIRLSKLLFRAEHVNLQPVSGVNANIAAFFALSDPGDRIMVLSIPHGGHVSHSSYSAVGMRKLIVEHHPFNEEAMNIDVDRMVKKITETKPKLIVFGGSLFLFPHPVSEASEVAEEVGAKIIYDASHVLGLIAGNLFQDPLQEGTDVVTGSTHKTFPGPQGALILCKKDVASKIDRAVFPGTVSNHHLHHLAGLAVTLAEMVEYGEEYAKQTVSNARSLAQSLHEEGLNVLCEAKGFTESHQVVLDVSGYGGSTVAEDLEHANIIANKILLPWEDIKHLNNPSGIRFGTQELTRIGMREPEMIDIANLIRRVMVNKAIEEVKDEVMSLRESYQRAHYCFDGEDAYAWE
jgi:glycine hydroxymethyltransferase